MSIWIENLDELIKKEKNYNIQNYLIWTKRIQINFYRLYKVKSKKSNIYKLSINMLKENYKCFYEKNRENHFKVVKKLLEKFYELYKNGKLINDRMDAHKIYLNMKRITNEFYEFNKKYC